VDNKETNKDKLTKELENENDTMKQSVMVARILADVSQQYERYFKRMWIVLIASIIANLIIVGAFLWYESQWEYETTTTTTQTVEGDSAEINNVEGNQYKDSATHYEGTEKTEPQGTNPQGGNS